MHASTAIAAAKARQQEQKQDLRSPDARHAALLAKQRDSAGQTARVQDLRSPDAADAALHPRKAPVVVNAPGATVVDSQTKPTPVAPATTKGDDGVDWVTVGIGIAGTLLVLGVIVAVTNRMRPTPRTRVSV
jgi:hypothetical protein